MKAIILAAGRGKRLGSEAIHIPKVLRTANGKPLLEYVLNAVSFIPKEDITLVVGYEKEKVINAFPDLGYSVQTEQNGTGHAVQSAESRFAGYEENVLVVCGDMPLMSKKTLSAFVKYHEESGNDCTLLTFVAKGKILPYGRIIRDDNDGFVCIIEEKEATEEQRKIPELNAGIYVFSAPKLFKALKKVEKSAVAGELYLTDVPEIMRKDGCKVSPYICGEEFEFTGVNTVEDLETVEVKLRELEKID